MNKWLKYLLIWVAIGFFSVPAIPERGWGADPIKLGVAGVHSGELASYGIPALRGVELAVRDINFRGGVLGRLVKLYVEDDLCKPKEAPLIASKLVGKGVHAVIGHTCSGATKAALDIYRAANILVISPSATHPDLTKGGMYPNFFRTIASDDAQAKVQVDFALGVLKVRKIAILHDKGVYGKGLAEFVKTLLENSGKADVVLYQGIRPASTNFSALVQKIKGVGAQAVIYGGYHPGASKIVREMWIRKMDAAFISGDGIKDERFIAVAGKHAEGVYATAPKDPIDIPMAMAVTRAYIEEFESEPGAFSLNAYAAVLALAHAMETAGSTDYAAVSTALKTEAVETPIGTIRFDERGDAIGVGFSIFRVDNGVFVNTK